MQGTVGNHAVAVYLARQLKTAPPKPAGPAEMAAEVEIVWQALLAFSKSSMADFETVKKKVKWHCEHYDKAWAEFSSVLSAAQRDAAEKAKWNDAIKGILVGTGVGLAAGALFTASKLAAKVLYEAVGETAELGVSSMIDAATGVDFAPPEATADKEARKHLEQLVEGETGLLRLNVAALAYSPRRDQLRELADGKTVPRPKLKPATPGVVKAEVAQIKQGLASAEAAFKAFLDAVDGAQMPRGVWELEQDIWISWMSRSPENANHGDGRIAAHLRKIGVLGRIAQKGDVLSQDGVHKLAQAEDARRASVGRTGVVVVPPRAPSHIKGTEVGVIKMRHDAYTSSKRVDPNPAGGEEHIKVTWEEGQYLRPGEVVLIRDTKASGVIVKRLGSEVAVSTAERKAGMSFGGIKEATYVPEASSVMYDRAGLAIQHEMREEIGKLKVSATYDGALVSEADGTPVILFSPWTSGGLVDARARRTRSGAARVVVYPLDGNDAMKEYRDAEVVMSKDNSTWVMAEEIASARQALGKQPAATR
jgi:hypothetical protein